MKTLDILKSLGIISILAIIAFSAWYYEIHQVVKWGSLKWIRTTLYSPWLVAVCTALAVVVPFVVFKKININNRTIIVTILLFILSIASYHIGEVGFKSWMSGLVIIVLLVVICGLVFFMVIHFLLHKISWFYVLGVWLAILGCFFMSTQLDSNWIDAIKLGYPFFFIVLNMGVVSTIAAYFATTKESETEFEDILDAPLSV